MNNVTVGKYIHGNSFIHRMDPRLKLAINIIIIVLVFITKGFIMLGILLTFAILIYVSSNLKIKQLFKMIKPVIFIGIILFAVNAFLLKHGYVGDNKATDSINYMTQFDKTIHHVDGYFWKTNTWWKLTFSDRAIFQTLFIMIRIYIMIIITSLLTATTKSVALTKAIEDLLIPLKLVKVPVHIIAMIISIALRFIPTLLEEAQRIMKAQASRGVDFKNGNVKSKAKSMITLIIPLFVSSFSKAEDLGNAMEVRGYDPYEKRTRYRSYKWKVSDYLTTFFMIGLIVLIALYFNGVIPTPNWWV